MTTRIATLARRWCRPTGCTTWVDYRFENGTMVAAKCACGTWVTF